MVHPADPTDEVRISDVVRPIVEQWRAIVAVAAAAAVAAAIAGVAYYQLQPPQRAAVLQFRSNFAGASEGMYPNGWPFVAADLVAEPVLTAALERAGVSRFCEPAQLLTAFSITQSSPALDALNETYQRRMTNPNNSRADYARLEVELAVKRRQLAVRFVLSLNRDAGCAPLPDAVAIALLQDVVETWAEHTARRMLEPGIAVVDPNSLLGEGDVPLVVRADRLNTALRSLSESITALSKLPAADALPRRDGTAPGRLLDAVQDLKDRRLPLLLSTAGAGLGPDSIRWLNYSLQRASAELRDATARRDAARLTLREYVGSTDVPTDATTPPPAALPRLRNVLKGDDQYRQDLGKRLQAASEAVVERQKAVAQYQALLETPTSLPPAEVQKEFDSIVRATVATIARVQELQSEVTQHAVKSGSPLYVIEKTATTSDKRFTRGTLALLVLAVGVYALVVCAIVVSAWPEVFAIVARARAERRQK